MPGVVKVKTSTVFRAAMLGAVGDTVVDKAGRPVSIKRMAKILWREMDGEYAAAFHEAYDPLVKRLEHSGAVLTLEELAEEVTAYDLSLSQPPQYFEMYLEKLAAFNSARLAEEAADQQVHTSTDVLLAAAASGGPLQDGAEGTSPVAAAADQAACVSLGHVRDHGMHESSVTHRPSRGLCQPRPGSKMRRKAKRRLMQQPT